MIPLKSTHQLADIYIQLVETACNSCLSQSVFPELDHSIQMGGGDVVP